MYLLKIDGYQWNGKEISRSFFIKSRKLAKAIVGRYVNPFYSVQYSVSIYKPFKRAKTFTIQRRGSGRKAFEEWKDE